MLREARRPQGDPEVLAAQSREQYFKVSVKSIHMVVLPILCSHPISILD